MVQLHGNKLPLNSRFHPRSWSFPISNAPAKILCSKMFDSSWLSGRCGGSEFLILLLGCDFGPRGRPPQARFLGLKARGEFARTDQRPPILSEAHPVAPLLMAFPVADLSAGGEIPKRD